MKSTVLTLLLGVSLTLGTTFTSRGEEQTIRIPQGRGQYIEVQASRPTTTVALFVSSERQSKVVAVPIVTTLHPVSVANPHGSTVLFETVR